MGVDSQPSMEETILVGDDLMMGPPSPVIPPEIASRVLDLTQFVLVHLILASGMEGIEGFLQRWSLHDRLTDTKKRLESLKQGMKDRKEYELSKTPNRKRWFFW